MDHNIGRPPISLPSNTGTSPSGEEPSLKRQKREKYTAVACNECKKRKIKCNGEPVCARCAQIGVECIYMPGSGEVGFSTVSRLNDLDIKYRNLQKAVDELQREVRKGTNGSSSAQGTVVATPERQDSTVVRPRKRFARETQGYAGPSSIQYGLDVGKSSLRSIGLQADEALESTVPNSVINTQPNSPIQRSGERLAPYDPLRKIYIEEGLRLIRYYEEELYPIYPIINAEHVEQVAKYVLLSGGQHNVAAQSNSFNDRDIDILRLTIATSLMLEGSGQSDVAEELASLVQENVSRRSWTADVELKDVMLMAMLSIYFFQCDEEVLAWRTIGQSVRIALEMGMHRHKSLQKMFPDNAERRQAIKLFWAIYVLDQRWSLGTGLPCALNQADIDPDLPELDDPSPYNRSLLSYARLSSKVMKSVDNSASMPPKERKEVAGYLDFQLQQWYQSMPPELHLIHPSAGPPADQQPRNIQRLRVLLFARFNHLRIVNRRYCLLSASRITENMADAQFVVSMAKDTIQVLAHLNRVSTIYQMQQSLFNYFLISALTALFLAVCHGSTYFGASCRPEFILALELIKDFSTKSLVSRRLWKAVREIRLLASKIGLDSKSTHDNAAANGGQVRVEDLGAHHVGHEGRNTMERTEQMGAIIANSIVPSNQTWGLDLGWSPGEDLEAWLAMEGHGGLNMASQMSYALTDLYETMGGGHIV